MQTNKTYCEDCLITMSNMPDRFIDLTVTSPPYDNLRKYKGYSFDFEKIASELFRVTKDGGIVVWIVGDETFSGSESGTSFRQALYFMSIGFNLHDTMIWDKKHVFGTCGEPPLRYAQSFEYIFVFSKGKIKTFNPIIESCKHAGKIYTGSTRKNRQSSRNNADLNEINQRLGKETKIVNNIFTYEVGFNKSTKDTTAFDHPAIFPEKLAADNIFSWSNEGDLIYDPFSGSGTTLKMAHILKRKWIGSEMSVEYVDIQNKRLLPYLSQTVLL